MGHTDVVPANADGWQRDPFGAELVDGEVWGRGAVDMLNLTATMAVAFRNLARSGFTPRGTLVYLAVADEENLGTWGADHLLQRRARRGDGRLRRHRSRRVPDPERGGAAPAGDRRREGFVLVPHLGARHARPRVAAVPHRQRARHRGRGRAAARRVPAADDDPRHVAALRRGRRLRPGVEREADSTRTRFTTSATSCRSAWPARRTRARTRRSRRRSCTAARRRT